MPCGSSGAMVIWRRLPSAASSSSSTSSGTGSFRHSGSWAPLRASARNGPSRCEPSTSGRRSIAARTLRRFSHITSIGLVISEHTCRVVPCTAWPARAMSMPSGPSSKDRSHEPCAWMSTYPGVSRRPAASMIRVSSAGSMAMERQACSNSSSSVPVAAMTPSAEVSQKCSRTPRASIFLAPRMAMREGAPVMAEVTRLTVSILLESMITPSQSWDLAGGLRCPARPACGRRRTRSSPCDSACWPPPHPR